MFGMSMAEMAVVAVIALVILGPEKLPEVARMAGKGMRELRKASNLFRDMLLMEEAQQDTKKRVARRMAEEAEREERDAPFAAPSAPAVAVTPRPADEDMDFMGPLDGPEDEFMAPPAPMTREVEMNPMTRAPDVREVELKERAILTASWHEVHLHTLTGELWR